MEILNKRASGVLLHITSLPSEFGIGDLGNAAFGFSDFLKKAGQQYWQILPLGPTGASKNFSPYACYSAFAGNPLLVSPALLYEEGIIKKENLVELGMYAAVMRECEQSGTEFSGYSSFQRAGGHKTEDNLQARHSSLKEIYAANEGKGYKDADTAVLGNECTDFTGSDCTLAEYGRVAYKSASAAKNKIFNCAYNNFRKNSSKLRNEFDSFCSENNTKWLEDFACFVAFKKYFKRCFNMANWGMWPRPIKDRCAEDIKELRKIVCREVELQKFMQFIFFRQWKNLKRHANSNGVKIFGDIPMYIDYESSDVWSHPSIFKLDSEKMPAFTAGVPPDYYSKTGQLWRNPVYDWEELKKTGFSWWVDRMKFNFDMFDLVRLDHFRGFTAYWEVPASEKTAINGRWVDAYPYDFFNLLKKVFGHLPIIAENLGTITPDVDAVMEKFGFPGIRVLQFAFGRDFPDSSYLPHNYVKNTVACTGTHDNNTFRGWLDSEARAFEIKNLLKYLSQDNFGPKKYAGADGPDNIGAAELTADLSDTVGCRGALATAGFKDTAKTAPAAEFNDVLLNNMSGMPGETRGIINKIIILLMASAASLIILPMQDILGLGKKARMNRPSTSRGNWKWQMSRNMISDMAAETIFLLTRKYKR